MTITEFLLARVAEDEADAHHVRRFAVVVADDGYPCGQHTTEEARVLAVGAAMRAITDEHERDGDYCVTCQWEDWRGCPTLRHLAAIYADHPDYDEAWSVAA